MRRGRAPAPRVEASDSGQRGGRAQAGPGVALAVTDIRKRFGRLEVLRGVSLEAHERRVVSILGASGSGKSTLLRCINLLEIPDGGEIRVRGERIEMSRDRRGRMRPRDPRQVDRIRGRVGMVFQQFNLWSHLTVLENVIEAPVHVRGLRRPPAVERARALLAKVGLDDKLDDYPGRLSGGQQQRAAIARALAMEPDVLLFDEPTSALDPELVGEVLKVIEGLAAEGRTMLIVTHELGFAREVSSETVFLSEGRVEERGASADLLRRPRSPRLRQFLAAARR